MNYATFTASYPEFRTASPELVEAKLQEAARRVSASAFGSRYDDAVALMAADLLWSSPFGATLRLDGSGGPSEYRRAFVRLREEVCPTFVVT
jgi:hypothetical protein